MPTQPIHTLQSKHFVVVLTYTLAIALFAAPGIAQQLHKGVSVQMATTTNAKPMPAADDEDARIVTVTADASVYFGTRQLTAEGLSGQMKTTPRRRDQDLYIKADAHAPFASVEKVLDAARIGFSAAVLLTSQPEPVASRKIVPPKGLKVSLGPESSVGAVVVQVLSAGERRPRLNVDGQQIEWSALKATLASRWQSGIEVVLLKADGEVNFEDVVHVIDACSSMDAKVILPEPEL